MSGDKGSRTTRSSSRTSMTEKDGNQLFLMPSPAQAEGAEALKAATKQPQHRLALLERHTTVSPTSVPAVRPKVVTSTPSISIQPTVDLAKYEMENYKPEEVEPHDKDVLCGRGGLTNYHPGNAWYRNMVRANRSLYKASPKHSKILVAKSICGHVLAQGSRFLECDKRTGSWFTISYKRAVDKTSQALREKDRYSDEPEPEINPIFASRAKGPFSIITHPPPDSNAPPRFIEDLKKRQSMEKGPAEDDDFATHARKEASEKKKPKQSPAQTDRVKLNKQSQQGKRSNESSNADNTTVPPESTVDAAVSVMASRMGAANGIANPAPANNVEVELATAHPSLNQDQAAAYALAHNVMQQNLQQAMPDRDRIVQVANLFWQRASNAKRLKPNPSDLSSMYAANPSIANFTILQQQNAALQSQNVALQNAALQKFSQQSSPQIVSTKMDDSTTKQLDTSATPKNPVTPSQFKQFLQEKATPSAKATETDDQFADSQEDQFADPEDEDEQPPLTSAPGSVPEQSQATTNADNEIEKARVKSECNKVSGPSEKLKGSIVDHEDEATAAMAMVQFAAATTKNDTAEAVVSTPSVATVDICSVVKPASQVNDKTVGDSTLKFGPICRVCKTSIMFRGHVPNPSIMNPELIWVDHGAPVAPAAMRHIVDMVHGHCRAHHPHWPLWNVLIPVSLDIPTAMNVFHRSLAASAAALPHTLGDTYDSVHELCYRIGHRIGLAKGWVWWFPWQAANQSTANYLALCATSKSTSTKLLVGYERTFIQAICENWEKLATMTHQERLDIYNNFFSVPFCIETLRVKGDLFPPANPIGKKLP
mmetsp:Transcript_1327/g.2004  ORF Transcript_1327/g.2004 Transcript_1327/m.2004 type:complete len:825 (-) Transcript_1327:516-2990(-)|eukprot:CAMPEP_0194222576 /NCGR_PEP_ID=MMETSP0156-20130528/33242_1 /TAXON_ID=33649 /ORGANISM="Thalassionema nitzschioides, Strain L26-B" /LENGTH=824 /DNA_ID=CAMNT_0038953411 /DNA_START=331 /DNA_END=2805 /DNA_ORIENTATION=+